MLFLLNLLFLLTSAQDDCFGFPIIPEPNSYITLGNCTPPVASGSSCMLECVPYAVPGVSLRQTCVDGFWESDNIPYCFIPIGNDTGDGVVYVWKLQQNFTVTTGGILTKITNYTSIYPISGPALFAPFGVVIRVTLKAYFPLVGTTTPRLSVYIGDRFGRLGNVNLDFPDTVASSLVCYQGDTILKRLGEALNISFETTSTQFVQWPYELSLITSQTNAFRPLTVPSNYSVELEWLDARLAIGQTKTFTVDRTTSAVAYFFVDRKKINIDENPLELTFRSDDETPVLIIVSRQERGLCTADTNYFENLAASHSSHAVARVARKTASTYATFILTRTSAPSLDYFDYDGEQGRDNGRFFVGVYFFEESGNASTKSFTLSLNPGVAYAESLPNAIFIVFFPIGAVLVQAIWSHWHVLSRLCPKYNCELGPDLPDGDSRWKSCADLCRYWFVMPNNRPYSYAWWTAVLGAIFGVTSYQVVISRYADSIQEGDLDLCYYNEACYVSTPSYPIPLNQILSNVPFVILGFGFLLHVMRTERLYRAGHDHSVFYALGLCLVGEGCFSALYHVCPAPNIFQFDTAFMYLISGLLLVAVYQTTESEEGFNTNFRFKSAKIFLLFISPLLIFNYVGTTIDNSLGVNDPVAYWFFVILWECAGFALAAFKWWGGGRPHESERRMQQKYRCWKICMGPIFFSCIVFFVLFITIANAITKAIPIASMFLYICVGVSLVSVVRLGVVRADLTRGRFWLLALLTAGVFILWIVALKYFAAELTDKALPPWESRQLNRGCEILGYYDAHDVWHIISAIALALTFALVFHINPPENEHGAFAELGPFLENRPKKKQEEQYPAGVELGHHRRVQTDMDLEESIS